MQSDVGVIRCLTDWKEISQGFSNRPKSEEWKGVEGSEWTYEELPRLESQHRW